MSLTAIAQVIYDSDTSSGLRESLIVFPVIEGTHLLSLAFSVGLLMLTDLRLVGLYLRDAPVSQVLHNFRPWIIGGFTVQFLTGFLLFIAEAARLVSLPVFWLKLVAITLAGANMLWFELRWGRRVAEWDAAPVPPVAVRFAGWASLSFWAVVVISGRLIPYLQSNGLT